MPSLLPLRKRAGQYRHSVVLQRGDAVTDPLGGRSQTWTEIVTTKAAIESEPAIKSELEAAVFYQVTLRYRSDVVTLLDAGTQIRVVGGGRTVKVLAMTNPEQRNIELILHCGDAVVE